MEKIFDKYLEQIDKIFTFIEENKNKLIEQYDKDIKKLISQELEDKIKIRFIKILIKRLKNH